MIYFLDTNCFRIIEGYYPSRFPSFWRSFNRAVEHEKIASVREVFKELDTKNTADHISSWMENNSDFFWDPNQEELAALAQIFAVPHFQNLVGMKQLLTGRPVADPFLIAAAMVNNGGVVTEERHKPNSAKIPTVCEHFSLPCMNLESMLTALNWAF